MSSALSWHHGCHAAPASRTATSRTIDHGRVHVRYGRDRSIDASPTSSTRCRQRPCLAPPPADQRLAAGGQAFRLPHRLGLRARPRDRKRRDHVAATWLHVGRPLLRPLRKAQRCAVCAAPCPACCTSDRRPAALDRPCSASQLPAAYRHLRRPGQGLLSWAGAN